MADLLAFLIVNVLCFLVGGIIGVVFSTGFFPMAWIVLLASWGIAVVGVIGCECDYDW